eukprot:8436457-Alexandrium_andersonii.AAC.1
MPQRDEGARAPQDALDFMGSYIHRWKRVYRDLTFFISVDADLELLPRVARMVGPTATGTRYTERAST